MSNSQWDNITNRLGNKEDFSIETFRSTPQYMLYGTCDPQRFGEMYLKTLIYNQFHNASNLVKQLFLAIKNRELGAPYGINSCGEFVCLDYIMAAYECEFIHSIMDTVNTVIEIGAGYGRTCHAIMSNFPVENYYIIDLPFSLEISSRYLKSALDANLYKKLSFLTNENYINQLPRNHTPRTLFINIDSMGEMPIETVDNYLHFIREIGDYFYCNNTLGKYNPIDVGERQVIGAELEVAISSGKIPGVINIFDKCFLESKTADFIKNYTPDFTWKKMSEGFTKSYPHYYQALYNRTN